VARNESELRHVEETRQRLEAQHTERRSQLTAWREQRAQLTQALHMWAARAATAKQRVAQAREQLDRETQRLPHAESGFRAAQEKLNETRSQLMQAESRLQLEQANLAHLERASQALAQRRERLQVEVQGLARPDSAAMDSISGRIAELDAALRAAQSDFEALQVECSALEDHRAAATQAHGLAQREHAAAQAQLETLRQIQATAEDNAPLREWLQRHHLEDLPRLWQKLRIEPGWETAVESALRERLHALELTDAARLTHVLGDQPPTRASIFEHGVRGELPAAVGLPLSAKVHATDAAIAGALADWLAGFLAVEGTPEPRMREALLPGTILVNRDGHQFTRHTVSFHAPDQADAGLLARQAEIEALEKRCTDLEARLAVAAEELQRAEAQAQERNATLDEARLAISERQKTQHDAQIEQLKLAQADERYRERTEQMRAELEELEAEAAAGRAARADCEAAAARVAEDIRGARERLDAARTAHVEAETALANQRRALQQAEREAQDSAFGERECASKIAEIDHSVRVIDQQIERADLEVAKLTEELASDPVPEVRALLDTAVEARIACERTLGGARDAVEAAAAALRQLEEARLQVDARVAPLRERVGELRLKEQAAQINHDQFAAQLEEARADEAMLEAQAAGAPRPSALQAEITRLGQAIAELGAVNMAALEELRSSEERKDYLDSQATDLEEAVRTLEDAIRRIDRETRELLRETFESVNRHFGSLFPTLFGGGEARLNMTGEEILDAGVQVMAQPPGKRNSSIHLLSGGEKALTAIALVFSLFQLNPAPFCLLDEVDAPLDDANTVRFCDLVKRMSAQTQFLFISHNKITMEMASQLIGVTMPESGVSRVVAVDIDEALRIREELAA
jgi:chromosome segregation protein